MPWLPLILLFSGCEAAIVADLPITEVPVKGHPSMMAVMYSGDGGWRDIDKQISGRLAAAGVPVIGVDSLRYFCHEKTPHQIARDLERIIARYGGVWHVEQVILIGYSFGADILPFAVNRLAPGIRSRLVQVSLLGVARTADFEIHLMEWLVGEPGPEARPVLPEIVPIHPDLLQCFYSVAEQDSTCRDPTFAGAEVIKTRGGHHFGGQYTAVDDKILAGAHERAGARRSLPPMEYQ